MTPIDRIATCEFCRKRTWCEILPNALPQCRLCKVIRFYEKTLYPLFGFDLIPWQRHALAGIYGDFHDDDGRRWVRKAYVSMAKKQGKSFFVAGLPVYHLLYETHRETMPLEVYFAAAAKDQANNMFKVTHNMVTRIPVLQEVFRIVPSIRSIIRKDNRGWSAIVSCDGYVNDGAFPSLNLIDELHRWRTPKARIMHDILTKGVIGRKEPLTIQSTTRGEQYDCPLWEDEDHYAQRVQAGLVHDRTYYAKIYAADKHRVEHEKGYWESKEARTDANPSHVVHGGFLKDEDIIDDLKRAKEDPVKKQSFIRYNLNVMSNASEKLAIDMVRWRENSGDADLLTWPSYDIDLLINKWDLMSRRCYAGVDLSSKIDLTAVTFVFPPQNLIDDPDQTWTLLPFVWMPELRVKGREEKDRVPYSKWVEQGFIETTQGDVVDSQPIKDKILWGSQMFDLQEVDFDEWDARDLMNSLEKENVNCIGVPQTCSKLNLATKKLIELYLQRRLRHGNHPVLSWCASCMSTASDSNDNIRPKKPDRMTSNKRIDAISATVTALARALVVEEEDAGVIAISF